MKSPPAASRSSVVEGVLVWWRLRTALHELQGSSEEQHKKAVETLIASSPRCWHGLRKIAFKEKGVRAVSAAKLLYDLGDSQGLFALLEQYSSAEVRREADAFLDQSLRQIGPERIEALLTEAIQNLRRRTGSGRPWGLAVAVYALRVLDDFRHPLPLPLLTQCILLTPSDHDDHDFDNLAACRSIFPFTAFTDYRLARPETVNDYYIGISMSAVRRVATDVLINQEGPQAFALLSEVCAHSDPQVQYAALYGLSRLRDERALPLFQRLASNRKHPLAHEAQRAIEVFGSKLPDILTLVRGSQPEVLPNELLRPAGKSEEKSPETLLRPAVPGPPPMP